MKFFHKLLLGTLEQNRVAKRSNHSLIDMVRSMISQIKLPRSFRGVAIKTSMYILNRIPSKTVPKTSFELLKRWEPSLNLFLSPKTIKYYLIGYPINAKGYRFFCLTRGTRIVDAAANKFLENDMDDCDIIVNENGSFNEE
ncbi:hypothetical protein CR513_07119, partial [Mucuna pruriens]